MHAYVFTCLYVSVPSIGVNCKRDPALWGTEEGCVFQRGTRISRPQPVHVWRGGFRQSQLEDKCPCRSSCARTTCAPRSVSSFAPQLSHVTRWAAAAPVHCCCASVQGNIITGSCDGSEPCFSKELWLRRFLELSPWRVKKEVLSQGRLCAV